MAMSENAQSRKAMNLQAKFERVHERIDACRDKINDPATPEWERTEMQDKIEAMTQQLDRMVKRQSTSEPPHGQEQPSEEPEKPEQQEKPSTAGASTLGSTENKPSHVVTPVNPGADKDKDKK